MYDGVVYYIIAHIYVLYRLLIYVTNRILAFVYIIYSTDILYTVSSHLFILYIPPIYGIYRIFAPFCYTSIITFPRTFLCLYTVCSQMFISYTLNSHFHMLYTVYSHHFLLYTAYLHLFIFVTRRCLAAAVIAAVVSVIGLRWSKWRRVMTSQDPVRLNTAMPISVLYKRVSHSISLHHKKGTKLVWKTISFYTQSRHL